MFKEPLFLARTARAVPAGGGHGTRVSAARRLGGSAHRKRIRLVDAFAYVNVGVRSSGVRARAPRGTATPPVGGKGFLGVMPGKHTAAG